MRRREFITLIGGAAAAWPVAGSAQQARPRPLVGWLGGATPKLGARNHDAFLQGLREHGHEDGKTVDIVYRWAEGDLSRLSTLANELVALNPTAILSAATYGNVVLMQSTATVPIIGALTVDPLTLGLAISHNHPGRNFTGVLLTVDGLAGKQAEILLQLLPHASTLGVLLNPDSPTAPARLRDVESALRGTSIRVTQAAARKPADLLAAFETFKRDRADGIIVIPELVLFTEVAQVISLAAAARLPALYDRRDFVEQGGLISYSVSVPQNFRRAAYFVDRILKGAKPGDLPMELPTKLELVINLKAAKALGIEIPSKLLFTADEVIE